MSIKRDQALLDLFSNKPIDFKSLDSDDKEVVFEVALCYPAMFKSIAPSAPLELFDSERFEYYSHAFLTEKENVLWLIENSPETMKHVCIYSDWYGQSDENIEILSGYVPASCQKDYYRVLKKDGDFSYSEKECIKLFDGIIEALKEKGYQPPHFKGLLELINDKSNLSEKLKKKYIGMVNHLPTFNKIKPKG